MKAAVIIFPGSNCDTDIRIALENLFKAKVSMIWHKEKSLPSVDLIILPGGFSYGDYLRPGSIAAKSGIINDIIKRRAIIGYGPEYDRLLFVNRLKMIDIGHAKKSKNLATLDAKIVFGLDLDPPKYNLPSWKVTVLG